MKLFKVNYGGDECGTTLAVFSVRSRAEKYLEYFKEVDEDSWGSWLPEIYEFEVDVTCSPNLVREIDLNEDGKVERDYSNTVEIVTKRAYDRLLFEPNIEMGTMGLSYQTTTINKEDAMNEALAAWMVMMLEGRFVLVNADLYFEEDYFPGDQWMAEVYDV